MPLSVDTLRMNTHVGGPSGVSRERMGLPPKPNQKPEPQPAEFEWDLNSLDPDTFPSWIGTLHPLLQSLPPPPRLSDFMAAHRVREQAQALADNDRENRPTEPSEENQNALVRILPTYYCPTHAEQYFFLHSA